MQSLQRDIKKIFDNEFNIFKSRHKDPVAKSNTRFNDHIKHLPEELKSKDKIINLTLLDNIANTEQHRELTL